jgi:general secretion pathway protein D
MFHIKSDPARNRFISGWQRRSGLRAFCLLAAVALLTSCATQQALREASERYNRGELESSLTTLEQALKNQPNQPELRAAYLRVKERSIGRLLEQADSALRTGNVNAAEPLYRRVLQLDSGNARAQASLVRIEREPQHAKWLIEGEEAFAKKEAELAVLLAKRTLSPVGVDNAPVSLSPPPAYAITVIP